MFSPALPVLKSAQGLFAARDYTKFTQPFRIFKIASMTFGGNMDDFCQQLIFEIGPFSMRQDRDAKTTKI